MAVMLVLVMAAPLPNCLSGPPAASVTPAARSTVRMALLAFSPLPVPAPVTNR